MRNKYAQICYVCGKMVEKKDGFIEREAGKWQVRHVNCESNHFLKRRAEKLRQPA